ncbi:MAG: ATP-binding protein [Solirubrobacterales bacterium]|nr:ATP-binding protein [Solirubrobacterales bacterium]
MKRTQAFRGRGESVAEARRFAREALTDVSEETRDAVELMVSELATNCVRHARSDFRITLELARGTVRVEARDSGQGQPTPRSPEPSEPSGRGRLIVEAMSERWGVIAGAGGKTVWFEVPTALSAEPASRERARQGLLKRVLGGLRLCAADGLRCPDPIMAA